MRSRQYYLHSYFLKDSVFLISFITFTLHKIYFMRKLILIAATTIVGFGAMTSCTKKSDSPSYSMKATVGTTAFTTSHCIATASAGSLTIVGWSGTSTVAAAPMMDIVITSWNGTTGTTNFDTTISTGYEQYVQTSTATLQARTGTVNITSVSTSAISGTFSFTATDGTSISGGTFTAQR